MLNKPWRTGEVVLCGHFESKREKRQNEIIVPKKKKKTP